MGQNRFTTIQEQLGQKQRGRVEGSLLARSSSAGTTSIPGYAGRSQYTRSFTADQRALVVLLENGGIDLGLENAVKLLPGISLLPAGALESLARYIDQKVRTLTDNLLESAEKALNRYQSAKPGYYGEVVVLQNGTALKDKLRDELVRLTQANKVIDLFILTHGSDDYIALADGRGIRGADIERFTDANNGQPLRIRSVYMMNCVGSSLNASWLKVGAKASCGSAGNNNLPEPMMYFFFSNWKNGKPFGQAATDAYLDSVKALRAVIEGALEVVVGVLTARIIMSKLDIANLGPIKDTQPVIAGDAGVQINSDALSFTKSFGTPFSYTVVPVSGSMEVRERKKTWVVTREGVDLVKSFEGFRSKLYNDPAGHATIGYGTLVHRGPINGDPSEAPYRNGISEEKAVDLLRAGLLDAERAINDLVKTELEPNQFNALVSFVYNVGRGNFEKSTLLRKLNEGDYEAVPDELHKWVNAGGKPLAGLVRRRNAEAELFARSGARSLLQWVGQFEAQEADEDFEGAEVEDATFEEGQSVTVPSFCPVRQASGASTAHFKLKEFNSRDGVDVPESLRGNVQIVMEQLEVLRAEFGAPITIVSGYRSPAHNKSVGGAKKSQHLCGTAADIKVKGYTPSEVHAKIEELIAAGRMLQGGLGKYASFVHYDIRGTKARW